MPHVLTEDQLRNRLQMQANLDYLLNQKGTVPVLGVHNLKVWLSAQQRLEKITHAMGEIERCTLDQGSPDPNIRWGGLLGEMDWRDELHLLLHNYPS